MESRGTLTEHGWMWLRISAWFNQGYGPWQRWMGEISYIANQKFHTKALLLELMLHFQKKMQIKQEFNWCGIHLGSPNYISI